MTDLGVVAAGYGRRRAPEVVYHLAALTHVGRSWHEPGETFRVNAVGTLNLLEAAQAREVPPVDRARQLGRGLRSGRRRQTLRREVGAPARQPVRSQQGGGGIPRVCRRSWAVGFAS